MCKSYNQLVEQDKINIIKEFKNGATVAEIPQKLNISQRAVSRVLKDKNINTKRRNRYTLDESYFDKIDSQEKAYILGFLYADGYVGDENTNNIVVSVAEQDVDVLEKIVENIKFTGELRVRNSYKSSYKTSQRHFILNFSSKQMAYSLRELGFNYIKRNRASQLPNIEDFLIRHFIRGFFDGDGSFSFSINRFSHTLSTGEIKEYIYIKPSFNIVGSTNFMKELAKVLPGSYHFKQSGVDNLVYIMNSSKKDIVDIYDYLYTDSTIYIKRKHDKFLEFMEHLTRDC